MCGRFTMLHKTQALRDLFKAQGLGPGLQPRYNIAPTTRIVVIPNEKRARLQEFRWGLVPHWAKDDSIGAKMINARAETLHEKPSFKEPLRLRRCLVIADGFYEWSEVDGQKVPSYIYPRKGGPITFAGLWDTWRSPDDEEIPSCTIITCPANEVVAEVHHRMPVIIPPAERKRWLDPEPVEYDDVKDLLVPYPAEEMRLHRVSPRVNRAAYDGADCILPV